jgi:hypothetical protein
MIKTAVKMIHGLRIFFLVYIIIGSLFLAGVNPVDIGRFVGAEIGSAVGMSLSIPENPFNKLALQLREKEANLTQKEQELNKREQELADRSGGQNTTMMILAAGVCFLFILVVFNYYLDYKRRKSGQSGPKNRE